ncbi:MAG TPA: helix-turn-helix transcriptional regulator [Pseudonocardiaceae bacterium]|jgi:transcriptional regulator with XRE-family HTH domain|nr:helix-turn-helix transcriptional regulator [Pseudonocardiaceae bacterium]
MAYTPKARALGAVLRRIREEKGLTLRDVTQGIHLDAGSMSRWENGERVPKPETVSQILTWYGVAGARFHEIMTLAHRTGEPQWIATSEPEQRQQLMAYVSWEQSATKIFAVSPLLVPGLLQTEEYIEAMMVTDDIPAAEIKSNVAERVDRRQAIHGQKPAHFLVLLGQSALNQHIGGRRVTIDQIRYLVKQAALPNIELRVVPDRRGWHPGLEGSFSLIEATPGRNGSIVFVDTRRSVAMLHEDADVSAYRRAVDRIMRVSLSPEVTVNYLADLVRRLELER